MVSSRQLMVGNFFNHPKINNRFVEIHTIFRYGNKVLVTDNPLGYLYETVLDELEPIELDSDILFKCGFVQSSNRFYINNFFIQMFIVAIEFIDGKQSTGKVGYGLPHHKPCIYLHQLQNLYYSLTGTELEIKL